MAIPSFMPLNGYPPWVELVMVHSACLLFCRPDLVMVEVGGVSDVCQVWRLFSGPDLVEVGGVSDGCQL